MFWLLFVTFLAAAMAAGATGTLFQPGAWYESINKPTWVPPNWAFPVVWTTLYVSMSIAAARVGVLQGVGFALALWALQIALNTLWTPVFFGLQDPAKGMIIVSLMWVAVAATMVAFFRHDLIAGLLFVPYLAWVTVAGALNLAVLRMN